MQTSVSNASEDSSAQDPQDAPVRVLHVLGYAGGGGRAFGITGVERVVQLLLQGLEREHFAQHVAYPAAGQLQRPYREHARALLTIEPQRRYDRRYVGALVEFARAHDIQVAMSMGLRFDFLTALACRTLGIPHVVHRPVALADEVMPSWRKRVYGIPDRWTLGRCSEIVACSQASARTMLRTQRVAPEKLTVIPNGVRVRQVSDDARRAARRELGIDDETLLIGGAGQLIARKAFDLAIEALQHAQARATGAGAALVLLGEGPERRRLEWLARARGVRLLLPGFVRDPYPLMAAFDVAVLPSAAEGMPLVVLESMALGVATIATSVAGTPELIEDGRSGLLVAPSNVEELASAFVRLITDGDLRARLGRTGADRTRRLFSLEAMLEGFGACLRRNAVRRP